MISEIRYSLNVLALFCLAIESQGQGTQEDYKRFDKLRREAESGDRVSLFMLGGCYALGHGVPKDDRIAFKLYMQSAEKGFGRAQYEVAVCYDRGYGVARDSDRAEYWYQKSAESGFAKAQVIVGHMHFRSQKHGEAFRWFLKASDQGNSEGMNQVANCYYWGNPAIPRNRALAFKFAKMAAELGNPSAQFLLAMLYDEGDGVLKDEIEAYAWFNVSAALGGNPIGREEIEKKLSEQSRLKGQERSKQLLREVEARKSKPEVMLVN